MHLSRRLFVRHASTLPLLGIRSSGLESAPSRPATASELDQLIQRLAKLLAQRDALDRRWQDAYRLLPAWCKPGPKFLDRDGMAFGPWVGWPATDTEAIPRPHGALIVRPSPADLRTLFDADVAQYSRGYAEEHYRIRSRQLIQKLRAKRACHRAYGLPITRDWHALDQEIEHIDAAIGSLSK